MQCCALGSTCGSACDTSQYLVNVTTTTTLTTTPTSSPSAAATTTTVETLLGCAPRQCTSTNYLCPSSLGGACCAYGSDCASSGQCIGPSSTSSSSTSTASALVSPVPSGCSAQGQTLCTAGPGVSGSGCCDAGYACTTYSSSLMCSPAPSTSPPPTATASGVTVVHHHNGPGGLSAGAKAGVAIGVIVGAGLVIGALTWLCLRRRRGGRGSTTTGGNEMRSVPPNHANTPGVHSDDDGGIRPYGPGSGPHMSESGGYAPSSTQFSRGGGVGGDYFGPGPGFAAYNNNHNTSNNHPHHAGGGEDGVNNNNNNNNNTWESAAATAGTPSHEQQQYHNLLFNHHHHQPTDDAAAPVEIGHGGSIKRPGPGPHSTKSGDPTTTARGYSHAGSDGSHSELADTSGNYTTTTYTTSSDPQPTTTTTGRTGGGVRDSIAGRFELYGSDSSPGAGGGGGVGGGGGQGQVGVLPQPFPTPGSEMSEFGTPSPMSREEQQQQQESSSQHRSRREG